MRQKKMLRSPEANLQYLQADFQMVGQKTSGTISAGNI
jgi:hypothetical protein